MQKDKVSQDLLADHLALLLELEHALPVLDLACGTGRNGLLLAAHGLPVIFADRSVAALETVDQRLAESSLTGTTWQVDLEQTGHQPFSGRFFSAIIVFRYLHRPLFPAILNAVMPGGLLVYETFTIANRRFGRPDNPDFLLKPGELKTIFGDWETLYDYEGILQNPDRHVAQIVARRPAG